MSQQRPTPKKPLANANAQLSALSSSMSALRTEADRARGIFGFGRRIIVPPDEIHVVVGDGRHSILLSNERRVFGQTADRPSRYWLNKLTQVIKLKTVSFTVPIRGHQNEGVAALDNHKVSFKLWAHAVAKLNPDKADVAAQRVGLDTSGLINTITEVGTAELIAAAATMELQDIIANRQHLAEIAFPKVNQILSELGYDLALLRITMLEGQAYQKLVLQAESGISKETSIATNKEQVLELQDDQARERTESEIQAQTEKKLAYERLEAQREVETATLTQQESLAVRRHELEVLRLERAKAEAEAGHETELTRVQLGRTLGEAEAEKAARLTRVEAERAAEIKLVQSEAEAKRLALEQIRQIERAAERTEAEALRLKEEELKAAERAKDIAFVEAKQAAQALEVEADAEANALQIRNDAQTKAEMVKAEAEANATEIRAQAAKIRAEATRAESAAEGLAEAEVETARVEVAERRVEVDRADGLAQAEIARAQAKAEAERLKQLKEVEINAQARQMELYEKAPVLVELDKLRMQYAHQEKLQARQLEASLKAFEALAPGIKVNIYGNGGQAGRLITDVMSLAKGVDMLGEEVPMIRRLTNGNGEVHLEEGGMMANLAKLRPYLADTLASMNPRMFTSLKVADLVENLAPVVAGQEDLASALSGLKSDANFRMVGDLPVGPFLKMLGFDLPSDGSPADEALLDAPEKHMVEPVAAA